MEVLYGATSLLSLLPSLIHILDHISPELALFSSLTLCLATLLPLKAHTHSGRAACAMRRGRMDRGLGAEGEAWV